MFRAQEPQTVEAMERLMEAKMIAHTAALEARLRVELAQAAPVVGAITSAVAHLSEAPCNLHQPVHRVLCVAAAGG